MYKILKKERLTPDTVSLDIHAPDIAKKAKAGQFVIVRIDEEGERIPLTIADFSVDRECITLVVQKAGFSTGKLVEMKEGGAILDVAGPLGKPSHIEKTGSVVCIGGGVGIAPVYPISRAFKESENYVTAVLAARSGNLIFWEDKFKKFSDETLIFTDDGSRGRKGLATDAVDFIVEKGPKPDLVIAVGPVVMMKFVSLKTMELGIKTIVSLNPVMVDGTGMCGGCRVTVGGKTYFACVDGPEFDGHKVDFDELIGRQNFYREEEKIAGHKCRMLNPLNSQNAL
jgi:NAD(P)H-flavin reductase